MSDVNSKVGQIVRASCRDCKGAKNCEVVAFFLERGEDKNYGWRKEWRILKCRGCDNVFAQTISTNSIDYTNGYDENGNPIEEYDETIEYWPVLSKRHFPEWMSDGGIEPPNADALDDALIELYRALNSDMPRLTAIGIRTCFDIASELLKIPPELTFGQKIEKLESQGYIAADDRNMIQILVEAGNASAHRNWKPTPIELNSLMDVFEHFIFQTFIVPYRKERASKELFKLHAKVPKREMRNR